MAVGKTLPAINKIAKCLPESPIRSYDARIPTAVKRVSEYQQAYKGWPWQPVRQNYKPEPSKKTNDKPMQKKTSYGVDYAAQPMQNQARVKKHKGALSISKKPLEKNTTYNMEFYTKQLPEISMDTEALWPVKKIQPEREPVTFEGESIYTMSYPAYQPQTISEAKPAIIIAKDNSTIPAAGDIVINPQTTVQLDFVPYQNMEPPEPIKPKGNTYPSSEPRTKEPITQKDETNSTSEPIPKVPPCSPRGDSNTTSEPTANDTKYKPKDVDPLKHIHLAKIKNLVEINPNFEAISTAMADFTAPSIPKRRKPKIPADNIQRTIAPFNGDTTFKMTYKEWPVMPPEHPTWAKKPVYKRRTGGFVTKSLYAKDFSNPHVVDRDIELRPVKRDMNIITNKPGNRPFNCITTYDNDYKLTERVKAPQSYLVLDKYKPPVMPMAKETIQMSDYKVHQIGLTLPIRHSSQHRELYDTADMTFDTTYNENFRGYRPKSCPSKFASCTVQNSPKRPKVIPIPKPDLSMLPKINAYPIITPPVTPVPSNTPKQDEESKTPSKVIKNKQNKKCIK